MKLCTSIYRCISYCVAQKSNDLWHFGYGLVEWQLNYCVPLCNFSHFTTMPSNAVIGTLRELIKKCNKKLRLCVYRNVDVGNLLNYSENQFSVWKPEFVKLRPHINAFIWTENSPLLPKSNWVRKFIWTRASLLTVWLWPINSTFARAQINWKRSNQFRIRPNTYFHKRKAIQR